MSCPLIGESTPMRRTLALAEELAATDYRVLIQGETGVGKSELARWMHQRSGRPEDRFVPCLGGEVPEGLEATYFFGAVRGAYTDLKADVPGRLEAAHGGTVFFDELRDFKPGAQAVILRFLDGGGCERVGSLVTTRPNARVIAASQLPLAQLVAQGDFRHDLMGRLADAIELFLPPLREHKEDLEALTARALEAEARLARAEAVTISREAFAILQAYDWPCNVRELIGVVRSSAFLARRDGGVIEPWHIKDTVRRAVGHDCGSRAECRANEVERVLVVCRGNLAETARRLDRKERTLRRWVKDLGIDLERIRREARGRSA